MLFLQDIQRLKVGQAQFTSGGVAEMQAIVEAAREKELRQLLLPEQAIGSYTPCAGAPGAAIPRNTARFLCHSGCCRRFYNAFN